MVCNGRRKFRSQTSDNMARWKAEVEQKNREQKSRRKKLRWYPQQPQCSISIQIFQKRAAKPSAGNTSAGFPSIEWPQTLLNLTSLCTKASHTFSGTFSGTFSRTWPGSAPKPPRPSPEPCWTWPGSALKPPGPSPEPSPETCSAWPGSAPKPPRPSPEPCSEPCWTWPGFAPKPPAPEPSPEPSPEPCWTWPGSAPQPPKPYPEPSSEPSPEPCWPWPGSAPKPPKPYPEPSSAGPLLEVAMSKKCTPLWREAHFEVKMLKTPGVRTTLGRSDIVSHGTRKGLWTLPRVSKTRGFCSIPKTMALQRCIFRGRRGTRDMFTRAVRRSGRWFPERGLHFGASRCSTSYDLASLFRGRRSTLDRWSGKIAKCIGTRPSALH